MADPETQPLLRGSLPPGTEQRGIFAEFRILGHVAPDIRTDMDVMVFLERITEIK